MKKGDAPVDDADLVPWLIDRLRAAYKGLIDPEQVQPGPQCATITFKGTGTVVDVVPVLYEGDANDCGYLVSKDTGDRLLTSVTLHLDFVRTRKKRCPDDWAQAIRFVKWWAKQHKDADPDLKFKSFMAELIAAHLLDNGVAFDDHRTALDAFFDYIVRTELRDRIVFTDYINASQIPARSDAAIEILDPVTVHNNVAKRYTDVDRKRIVTAASSSCSAPTAPVRSIPRSAAALPRRSPSAAPTTATGTRCSPSCSPMPGSVPLTSRRSSPRPDRPPTARTGTPTPTSSTGSCRPPSSPPIPTAPSPQPSS